jgi:hypothetical protein
MKAQSYWINIANRLDMCKILLLHFHIFLKLQQTYEEMFMKVICIFYIDSDIFIARIVRSIHWIPVVQRRTRAKIYISLP